MKKKEPGLVVWMVKGKDGLIPSYCSPYKGFPLLELAKTWGKTARQIKRKGYQEVLVIVREFKLPK